MHLKTPGEIDAMRAPGLVVARILAAAKAVATVGSRPVDLDQLAREILAEAGAGAPFLHYQPHPSLPPFPGVICVSVNDVALHGIPDNRPFADGDLVSVDCGAELDGWVGDAAISFIVGTASEADLVLIDCAERALAAGIAAAIPGNQLGDVSAAIGRIGRGDAGERSIAGPERGTSRGPRRGASRESTSRHESGYGINTDYGGHGVGRTMHESPSVPNEGRPHRGLTLRSGLVIAIEPWFLGGGSDGYRVDADGWSLRSADGSRAVHVEHTAAVTPDGPVVLTAPAGESAPGCEA